MPKREWRVLTSEKHSTVYDGEDMLFDFNFLALGIPADEAYQMAREDGEELKVGKHLKLHYAEHYSIDAARVAQSIAARATPAA